MIKLRVEWLHTCPECGTQLVVDFACDEDGCRMCPWCGQPTDDGCALNDPEFRRNIDNAVVNFEDDANGRIGLST